MSQSTHQNSNIPEFSVTDLANALKRTVEETYSRVRVRGELSRISVPKSGHLYTSLKEDRVVLDAVCWKGVLSKLSIKPEEGLEVICTGKLTTFTGSSKYQLVIDSMELAGEGALLKMLEERKKKLTAEGLFAPERKKCLPFLPERIGVVTSPTGAVIRDILHRLQDRFPRHVMIWPVKVQGAGSDQEITNAINGFNAMPSYQKPDLIIVARGGGSLEDLMAFNEENVVRATAQSVIPIISAVGHETDTTLIDYAADIRAPTPTGAAEMAVPVRLHIMAQMAELRQRMVNRLGRLFTEQNHRVGALSAKLGDPTQLLALKTQHVDRFSDRLRSSAHKSITEKQQSFLALNARLTHPAQLIDKKKTHLRHLTGNMHSGMKHYINGQSHRLDRVTPKIISPQRHIKTAQQTLLHFSDMHKRHMARILENSGNKLQQMDEKLELLSFENILNRGYVVIRDDKGQPITDAQKLSNGQNIDLQFKSQQHVNAVVNTGAKKHKNIKPMPSQNQQDTLF